MTHDFFLSFSSCTLCNKEFCNKYFLKTHKANKHNIYEPPVSSSDTPTTSQLNQMSQVFQIQQHQMAQQQQANQASVSQAPSQGPPQSSQPPPSVQVNPTVAASPAIVATTDSSVFCDVCFKRFTNVFAMRRHRSKIHEIPPPTSDTVNVKQEGKNSVGASNTSTPLTVPDGFREDFTIEQEDTSFTPQPRKLSPQSMLQAREANFSVDKLKRLGVINPEAL